MASSGQSSTNLMFQPFSSHVDISFWHELSRKKLEEYKLDSRVQTIVGHYGVAGHSDLPPLLSVSASSFMDPEPRAGDEDTEFSMRPERSSRGSEWCMLGDLCLVNTVEEFKGLDKKKLLSEAGEKIASAISSGEAVWNPTLLNRFLLLVFADLKKHFFLYWFAFPAVVSEHKFQVTAVRQIQEEFDAVEMRAIEHGLVSLASISSASSASAISADVRATQSSQKSPAHSFPHGREVPPCFLVLRAPPGDTVSTAPTGPEAAPQSHVAGLRVLPLSSWPTLTAAEQAETIFGFVDPSQLRSHPGWPLRNLLYLLADVWGMRKLRVLCYRERVPRQPGANEPPLRSIVLHVHAETQQGTPREAPKEASKHAERKTTETATETEPVEARAESETGASDRPRPPLLTVGWEANVRGKMGPRQMNLASLMDPSMLAEASVDLNLKLMRWRQLQSLDTAALQDARCLILGAGTLGCAVARQLLAWGVRQLVLVDNGRVSYSNPSRQSLFEFSDCVAGGKPKAEAAAEALRRIFPGVRARGVALSIPMPGHPLAAGEEELATRREVQLLDALVQDADVVFLGTDSRESRWLPTVMAAAKRKLLINIALGFDTFVVMRHGLRSEEVEEKEEEEEGRKAKEEDEEQQEQEQEDRGEEEKAQDTKAPQPQLREKSNESPSRPHQGKAAAASAPARQLGCYFCNDVVAPENSLRDRSLDQMCTVTRPGAAPVAAALGVELFVSVLHHPQRGLAPAEGPLPVMERTEAALGLIPHQIRGFLSHFQNVLATGQAFASCSACSEPVVRAYATRGFDFVREVCHDPRSLAELTGLRELTRGVEDLDLDFDSFDED